MNSDDGITYYIRCSVAGQSYLERPSYRRPKCRSLM